MTNVEKLNKAIANINKAWDGLVFANIEEGDLRLINEALEYIVDVRDSIKTSMELNRVNKL